MIIRDKEGLIKRADVIFTSRYVRMIVRMNTESSKVVVVATLVRVIANIHPSQHSLYESSMAHQQCTLPGQSRQQLDIEEYSQASTHCRMQSPQPRNMPIYSFVIPRIKNTAHFNTV